MSDLEQLSAMASEVDGVAAAAGMTQEQQEQAQQEQQGPDYAKEAAGMVDMFTAMVTGYAPATVGIWNDAAKQRTAAALAPVLEKYGVSFGALPVELTLAIVAGPLLWQSARAISQQAKADKVQAQVDQPQQNFAQANDPESLGAGVHQQVALYQQ